MSNKKPKDKKPIPMSFLEAEGKLFEQVLLGGTCGDTFFMSYDTATGKTEETTSVETGGETFAPIVGDELTTEAIRLPSGVKEYGDTEKLLEKIEAHFWKWLDIPQDYQRFASYYVLLSWVYDRLTTLPYLRALGDTGTGKSRFLDVIGGICYKPFSASGCITPAPIYRMIGKWGCTLVLDEADWRDSDEKNEVVTILNCGFEKGRPVMRCVKDKPSEVEALPVYSPKILSTRRTFKDVALEARCLTTTMRQTLRSDIPSVLTASFWKEEEDLRKMLLLWRFRNFYSVNPDEQAIDLGDIEPRLKQVGSAFGAVFVSCPEILEDFKEFLKVHQRDLIEQRSGSMTGQVVNALFALSGYPDIRETFTALLTGETLLDLTPKRITEKLNEEHNLDLKPQTVGLMLKGLGIKTKFQRRPEGNGRFVLYDEKLFESLKRRYIPIEEDEISSPLKLVEAGDFQTPQGG